LRATPGRGAPELACLPGASVVTVARFSGKLPAEIVSQCDTLGSIWAGGDWWVYVRAAQGQEGWVAGTEGGLAWAL
jgi:hypothetical protein